MNTQRKKTLLLALAIDLILGDPPNRFHPVVWMGNLLKFLQRGRPHGDSRKELFYGAGMLSLASGIVALLGKIMQKAIFSFPTKQIDQNDKHKDHQRKKTRSFSFVLFSCTSRSTPLGFTGLCSKKLLTTFIEALLLKSTFALRSLDHAAGEVQSALESENLPKARSLLSWHLVSRNTENLNASEVSAAAIESVAENASDGLVAPIFYYLLGGIPWAFAYRLFNTADSLYGYRTSELEWFGKVPAYVDDLFNFIPARLTAFLIALSAPVFGLSAKKTMKIVLRDAKKTESPNAGYPMSAMAGALGVELAKEGHYSLGSNQAQPTSGSLLRARKMLFGLAGVGVALALLIPTSNKKNL